MQFYGCMELIQSLLLHNWAFKNKEMTLSVISYIKNVQSMIWFFFVRNYLVISLLSNGLNQLSLIL